MKRKPGNTPDGQTLASGVWSQRVERGGDEELNIGQPYRRDIKQITFPYLHYTFDSLSFPTSLGHFAFSCHTVLQRYRYPKHTGVRTAMSSYAGLGHTESLGVARGSGNGSTDIVLEQPFLQLIQSCFEKKRVSYCLSIASVNGLI